MARPCPVRDAGHSGTSAVWPLLREVPRAEAPVETPGGRRGRTRGQCPVGTKLRFGEMERALHRGAGDNCAPR